MNKLNFLSSISPHEQKKIAAWYTFSIACFFSVLVAIIFLQIQQLHKLSTIKKTHKALQKKAVRFEKAHAHHHNLERRYKHYQQCAAEVDKLHAHNAIVFSCIKLLTTNLPQYAHLNTLSIVDNAVRCTIQFPTMHKATHFVTTLRTAPEFTAVKLISLQKNKEVQDANVRVSFRATLAQQPETSTTH